MAAGFILMAITVMALNAEQVPEIGQEPNYDAALRAL